MGDIADLVLEGICCSSCGVAITNTPPGHPQICSECQPRSNFDQVQRRAALYRLKLVKHSERHYSLTKSKTWRLNIYPTNQRLYADQNLPEKAPYLKRYLSINWTVADVVEAIITFMNQAKCPD